MLLGASEGTLQRRSYHVGRFCGDDGGVHASRLYRRGRRYFYFESGKGYQVQSFARVTKLPNIGGRADYISNPERQKGVDAPSSPGGPDSSGHAGYIGSLERQENVVGGSLPADQDAAGRADYISNPKRQENIVAVSPPVDWKPYQEYERTHQKTSTRNNEGREVIIALPNGWAELTHGELSGRSQALAILAAGKETDMQWAVHWNKKRTNLHMHVIFSERTRTGEMGTYDRDIYLTSDGKVARRKADRAKDAYGRDKPPVHWKGEEKGGFTAKNTHYKEKSWMYEMKAAVKQEMERLGVDIKPREPLSQYHEGKGKMALEIHQKNELIKKANPLLKSAQKKYNIPPGTMDIIIRDAVKVLENGLIPAVRMVDSRLEVVGITQESYAALQRAAEIKAKSKTEPRTRLDEIRQKVARPAPISGPHSKQRPDSPQQQPVFSFAALLEAQREYFLQLYTINDKRKPINQAIVNAPDHCKKAFAEYTSAKARLSDERAKRKRCNIFQWKKKASLDSNISKIDKELDAIFDNFFHLDVFSSTPNIKTRAQAELYVIDISRQVQSHIERLQFAADAEIKNARPENAPKPSPEAVKIAQKRFCSLLREITPENREMALKTLSDNQEGLISKYNNMASVNALIAIQNTIKKESPEPPVLDKIRQRGRSWEPEL